MTATTDLTLHESARWLAGRVWLEERTFELLVGFGGVEPDPAAKILLASQARHHADHADRLGELLPTTHDLDGPGLVASPDPGLPRLLDDLRGLAAPEETPVRLAAVYAVWLPALERGYRARLDRASPYVDAALRRVLAAVVAQAQADLAQSGPVIAEAGRLGSEVTRDLAARLAAVGGLA